MFGATTQIVRGKDDDTPSPKRNSVIFNVFCLREMKLKFGGWGGGISFQQMQSIEMLMLLSISTELKCWSYISNICLPSVFWELYSVNFEVD